MSLQDILKEILNQADVQVEAIKAELEQEKAELKKTVDAETQEKVSEVKTKGEKAAENVKTKMEELARKEGQKRHAQAKRAVVDAALKALVAHLSELGDAEYKAFFTHTAAPLSEHKGTFYVPTARADLVSGVCPAGSEVKASAEISSGYRFVSSQFSVDNTFENLVLSEYRSQLEMYFADKLKLN